MFFWNSLAFNMIQPDVGNLISGFSGFSKSSLNIWKFTVHILLKPGLENFEHYFASVWAQQSQEEPKILLMKVKEESEKVGLKLNNQKTKIMASSPITSWQTDWKTMATVTDFILGAPKSLQMVTAAMKLKDACSLEEKLWPNLTAYEKTETLLCQQKSI